MESYPADLPTGDPESAAIIAGWQDYQGVFKKFSADPFGYTDFSETQYVSTGDAANLIIMQVELMRRDRVRSEGGFVFRDLTLVAPESGTDAVLQARLEYCVDVSGLKLFYIDTGEQLPRSGTFLETAIMEQGKDARWRVFRLHNIKQPC